MTAPRLPDAPGSYDAGYMSRLLGSLRTYFTQLDAVRHINAASQNFDLGTLPVSATGLRDGDVYADGDVLKVKGLAGGGGAVTTTNAVTFNNGGAGAASGTSFNGGVAVTVSYNTVGAAAASHTHAWGDITGTPTTLAGYGITDFNSLGDARWLQLSGGTLSGTLTVNNNAITATATSGRVSLGVDSGGSISMGRIDNVASTPYIDFNSGATTVDYDARIMASGGTGSIGGGTLTFSAATYTFSGTGTAINAARLRLTDETDVSAASTGHAFQIGPTAGTNLAIDGNEIMARVNGAVSTLYLNNEGGGVVVGGTLSTTSTSSTLLQSTAATATDGYWYLLREAGRYAALVFRTGATTNRWLMGVDNNAESGSNAGSNFFINRYDDAGTYLGIPLTINRASGVANFASTPTVAGVPVLTANQSITLSGDISGTGATAITTAIGANKVTNAMLAQVATATFKGRTTAATGNVEDLTATQATALLNTFTTTLKGLAPSSGGGTTNYLRADGTWAAPVGTTNLSYTASTRVLASDTGTDATLPLFTSTDPGLAPLSGGGTTNFLRADGTWAAPPSGGTPGGSNTQVQFNDSGAFGGDSAFTWDKTNNRLLLGGAIDDTTGITVSASAGVGAGISFYETSSGNTARLRIYQAAGEVIYNATYGSGGNAHVWQVGNSEKMRLDSNGTCDFGGYFTVRPTGLWTTSGWGRGILLNQSYVLQWKKGASSYSWGMGQSGDGFYLSRSTAEDNSAAVTYMMQITNAAGDATFVANVTAYSDIRKKKDIEDAYLTLDQMQKMRPVTYTRIEDDRRGCGGIAQEIEQFLPLTICEDTEGFKSVDYGRAGLMVGLSLAKEVAALKAEVGRMRHGVA